MPLDGRDPLKSRGTRANPPGMLSGRESYTYFPGQEHLPAPVAPNLVNRSFSIIAEVNRPKQPIEGVLLSRGDRNGGFTLYVKDGLLIFDANHLGWRHTVIRSQREVPVGKSTLCLDYTRIDQTHGIGSNIETNAEKIAGSPDRLAAALAGLVGRPRCRPRCPFARHRRLYRQGRICVPGGRPVAGRHQGRSSPREQTIACPPGGNDHQSVNQVPTRYPTDTGHIAGREQNDSVTLLTPQTPCLRLPVRQVVLGRGPG